MTLLNGRVLILSTLCNAGCFLYLKGGIMADGIQVEVDLSKLTKGFDKLGKAENSH
ncbi:MAG: hypothetical protein IJ050_10605 [Clostridia bacterium]|nr:hypothetical protein [Clostridia bacterium]